MNNILAIELSTELCSVSILYNNKIFNKYKYTKITSSKYILILIFKLIKKNNIKIKLIKYLAFNNGPGSIIGTRISSIICKTFKLKYKNLNIFKINTQFIISEDYFTKKIKNKNNIINIIIYNDINNIHNFIFKNNKLLYSKKKKLKNINKYINKIKKKQIIVNKYETKQKIIKIIELSNINYKKKIKIIYPKSKYIIKILKKYIKNKKLSI